MYHEKARRCSSIIQRRKSWHYGNSRRETCMLETKQSGGKSEVASTDRFGSRALEGERRCTSRSLAHGPSLPLPLSRSSTILSSLASSWYQIQSLPALPHLSTVPVCGYPSASTRPVVFTRCGLSACIPRPPRVRASNYIHYSYSYSYLGHAAAQC